MANIFGILTTVVLIFAILLAAKNKTRYDQEIQNLTNEKQRLEVTQQRLATAQSTLGEIIDKIPRVEGETQELTAKTETQRAENARLESQLQENNNESSGNLNRITQLQEQVGALGNVEQLADRLRSLQAELNTLNDPETGLPSRKTHVDRISAQATQIEADNVSAAAVLDGYARGQSKPGLTTRIRSIYPNWGFVTLASGGIAGLAGNSTMDVIRDNQVIAKLQVTAVEPNSATATIVPGSMQDGFVLQVGDNVLPSSRMDGN